MAVVIKQVSESAFLLAQDISFAAILCSNYTQKFYILLHFYLQLVSEKQSARLLRKSHSDLSDLTKHPAFLFYNEPL